MPRLAGFCLMTYIQLFRFTSPSVFASAMRLSKVVVLPLLVGTAHGLNGLWPEAVTKPVDSYPGSSNDCHDGLSCRACLSAGCGFYGSCLPSCDMIADVACYEGDAEKRCAAYANPNPIPHPHPHPNPHQVRGLRGDAA